MWICVAIFAKVYLPDVTIPLQPNPSDGPDIPLLLAIGAVLYAFAGHISVSNGANLILKRRNAGPDFIKGAAAGMATMTLFYAVWSGAVIIAMLSGALPVDRPLMQGIGEQFGPIATVASIVFVILTLGIGSGNYAMAAYHVMYDALHSIVDKTKLLKSSDGLISLGPQVLSLATVVAVMIGASVAFSNGQVDLAGFFGLIGGLMAPIVAGVFPVLLHVACKARGVEAEGAIKGLLSTRVIAVVSFAAFLPPFISQALSVDHYPVWYRFASGATGIWVLIIVVGLVRTQRLSPGYVALILKSKNGWDPRTWQFFENGNRIDQPTIRWKAARNAKAEHVTANTSPVRVLSSLALIKQGGFCENQDIVVYYEVSEAALDFEVAKFIRPQTAPSDVYQEALKISLAK